MTRVQEWFRAPSPGVEAIIQEADVNTLGPARTLWFAASILLLGGPSWAQSTCNEWQHVPFPLPGTDDWVNALAVFDDGSGPALYLGGRFTVAGDVVAAHVARWNGASFSPLGPGVDGPVYALAVFDDGRGPALYAGGRFATAGGGPASNIARWDGRCWSALGSGTSHDVLSLAVFDDDGGSALYAGGLFGAAGGGLASHVAKWDGVAWSALGTGTNRTIRSLAVFDEGNGPRLFAGGDFGVAGGGVAPRLARWDGGAWSSVGTFSGSIQALAVFDDGTGPALYMGGNRRLSRWNGVSETTPGDSPGGVKALTVFDDGSGAKLYAGGSFGQAGSIPVSGVARWNGATWSALGSGVYVPLVGALVGWDDVTGPALFVGGSMWTAGGIPVSRVARWKGGSWGALGTGLNGSVLSLCAHDLNDGSGPALYFGGSFEGLFGAAGSTPAHAIAQWNGAAFRPLGSGLGSSLGRAAARALATFDFGSGPVLCVGGTFDTAGGASAGNIATWDGANWASLGGALSNRVLALQYFDDGSSPALFAGGDFTVADGADVKRIARWNGAGWSPLGAGINGSVRAMTVFDDGSGPALYAAGHFTAANGVPANHIVRWDGSTFTPLGRGLDYQGAHALAVFDDGGGPALYVGGSFIYAGDDVLVNRIARWNGTSFSAVGGGFYGEVYSLAVFDDGSGPALYAAGAFATAGGVPASNIARWNGSTWTALGTGTNDFVHAILGFDDGSRPALIAGGDFSAAGGVASAYLAAYGESVPSCRRGNVNRGAGSAANVLFVNGGAGGPLCRTLTVLAGSPTTISILQPPVPGTGDYIVWGFEGVPSASDATPIRYRDGAGHVHDLGQGCRVLPSNNLVARCSSPCPGVLGPGRTSRSLGPAAAARVCTIPGAAYPRAPTFFEQTFPAGTFTLCGIISDNASSNSRPISLMNWVVVEAR